MPITVSQTHLQLAEHLRSAQTLLTRDDLHGLPYLAFDAPGTAYSSVREAFLDVLTHALGDADHAQRIYDLTLETGSSVAEALDIDGTPVEPLGDVTFEGIAEAQGWGDASVANVLMDFIDNHADKRQLIAYAQEVAAVENA